MCLRIVNYKTVLILQNLVKSGTPSGIKFVLIYVITMLTVIVCYVIFLSLEFVIFFNIGVVGVFKKGLK
jgi:hypothetical protein